MGKVPQELLDLKFDLKDCHFFSEQHSGKKKNPRPVKFGISNGEIDFSDPSTNPDDPMAAARRVYVTHIPTQITVSVDRFMPKRNREVAIELLKGKVEAWVASMIEKYEKL